jgi:predicted metallo-beta-lactamase superfamily hydrolase
MCTFVKTKNVNILIDPGVSLAPSRYRLPPHPKEINRQKQQWSKIVEYAKKSDIIIITHYHYDHHNPEDNLNEVYKGKTVFIKHPDENINISQKKRAKYFLQKIKTLPKQLEYSDSKEFVFEDTKITFSPPVFHGTNSRLGYVTEILIDDGYKFIYTSDIEGPALKDQTDFIINNKPNLLILDGPLSYMLGYRYSYEALEDSIKNIIKIILSCPLDALIIEHHFLRDLKWKERISEVFEMAEKKNVKIQTAADFIGMPVELFEAHRRDLYKKYPQTS